MDKQVFEEAQIKDIRLKNRIIRSATHEGLADEAGQPTEMLKKKFTDLAKGGAGAIITGHTAIRKDGRAAYANMSMIDNEECIPGYKAITDEVHQYGTPIIMQLSHCGRQTRSKVTGYPTVAPSAIRDGTYNEDIPRELSEQDILDIIHHFVLAVKRAKTAGFDGVQLHLAHGYLLSSFLSPHMNKRSDKWGGSTENRFRIVREIIEQAHELVGDYPILVKINADEKASDGMKPAEAVEIAKLLEKAGCAAIEVSCGILEDNFYTARGEVPVDALLMYNFRFRGIPGLLQKLMKPVLKSMLKSPKPILKYNVRNAAEIRRNVSIPVIVVGGIGKLDDITGIIAEGSADFVSMCRPFIIEPNIVGKFMQGKQKETKCIYCNCCSIGIDENPVRCYYGKVRDGMKV